MAMNDTPLRAATKSRRRNRISRMRNDASAARSGDAGLLAVGVCGLTGCISRPGHVWKLFES
jgi:hypothetical protein